MAVNIEGVRVVYPTLHRDARGYFFESWSRDAHPGFNPVQANVSFSRAGVLRGMHFHEQQADFWVVPCGHVRVVLYDMRASSTPGRTMTLELRADEPCGLYIPPRVAHGFYAVTDSTMTYLVDRYYFGGSDEHGIRWDDPAFVHAWGDIGTPVVSERDRNNPSLDEIG